MSQISVVIVTYNSERTIEDCLTSIIKYSPGCEIIIIDNGSGDDTLKIVNQFGQDIQLIRNRQNLGFSKANNLGATRASGEYLVFLNPDAMLTQSDSLERLAEALGENTNFGIVGPRLIYPDGSVQPKVRNFPTVYRAFKEYVLGTKGSYCFYTPDCQALCQVETVAGACMVIKKELFQKMGGFNEKYFMYYEDIDLCRKIRKLGLKVGFIPEITIVHAEGVSAGQNRKTNNLMKDSAKKYFGLVNYFLLEPILFYNRVLNKLRKISGRPLHA